MSPRRVVVVGASGTFGRRLARHLAREPAFELVLTARQRSRSQAICDALAAEGARAALRAVAFERGDSPGVAFTRLSPWAVVDCSGPFQCTDFALATAALGAGAHFVDLADAPAYIARHARALDGWARDMGVAALAGASSTPGLSGAAVAALVAGWQRVDDIDIAILPGGAGDVGPAVLEAVTSYAGRAVPLWQGGRLTSAPGWLGGGRLALPGEAHARRVALVETADAALLGVRYAVTGQVRCCAGLESRLEQTALRWLALARRARLIGDPAWLPGAAAVTRRVTRPLGSDRGGMIVRCRGIDTGGRAVEACWRLVAERGDGLVVPVLPAAAALRMLADGRLTSGAQDAGAVLSLADIEHEMGAYALETAVDTQPGTRTPCPSPSGRPVPDVPTAAPVVRPRPKAQHG